MPFFLFSSYSSFSFPFCRSPLSPFFSFCLFPFVSCVAFLFVSMLYLGADPVLLSRCYTPPRATCEPASLRIPLVCCLLSFCRVLGFCFVFSSLPSLFSISIWTSYIPSCLFLVGIIYAVSSVSVSVAFVLFTLNRSFYPSTSSIPSVRADSSS